MFGQLISSRNAKLFLALLALLCLAYAGRAYFGELSRIREARLSGLLAMAAIHALTLWLQGMSLKISLSAHGNHISSQQGFAVSVMSSYANLLLPRSGIATTAAFLIRQSRTKMIDYSSIVLYNAGLFVLCSSGLALLLCLGHSLTVSADLQPWLTISLAVLMLAAWLAVRVRWKLPKAYRGPASIALNQLCLASSKLRSGNKFWLLTSVHLLLTCLRATRLLFAFWAMGIDVHPLGVLLASTLGDLVFIFAITPAALGFREAAISFSAGAMSTTAALALSVAILDRIVFSGTVIILAQLVITCLIRRANQPEKALPGQLASGASP